MGDVIEHPVSGETMVFLWTGEDTDGELLQIDLFVREGGAVSVEHIHPNQEERFVVKRGEMTIVVDGEQRVLRAGDEATVPAGSPHVWWNSGDEELNTLLELRPAGRFDEMITTLFGLAKTGHVNDRGLPSLLQMSVTLSEYDDVIRMVELSPFTRSVAIPVLAFAGKMLGLRAYYPYPKSARVNNGMEIWRTNSLATVGR
jgi:quercetin dioxygenase-like cupin family protein